MILSFMFPVLLLVTIITVARSDDHYLLSCGADTLITPTLGLGKQMWESDKNSTFSGNFSSTTAATTTITVNVQNIPFATARVFTSSFTYSFPVSPGPKFIRLFFYPSPSGYTNSSIKDAYLTLSTNTGHRLLRNFSAYLSLLQSPETLSVQKEFYVNVTDSPLQLTFAPSPGSSYAFVNGIEVASVPKDLYVGHPSQTPIQIIPGRSDFQLNDTTALETAYRLNVGGNDVGPVDDVGAMYRSWGDDELYLTDGLRWQTGLDQSNNPITYTDMTPNYTAPDIVYRTYRIMGKISNDEKRVLNLAWGFQVDLGFIYLVRLYWCEVSVDINGLGKLIFDVYIDNQLADGKVDIFALVGDQNRTAVFKDYAVSIDPGNRGRTSRTLEIALRPIFTTAAGYNSDYVDVQLNGLEIFKMSRTVDGSLDAPNPSGTPDTPIDPSSLPRNKSNFHVLPAIIGGVVGATLLTALLCFIFIFICRRRKFSKTSVASTGIGSTKSKGLFFSFGAKSSGTTKRSGGDGSLPSHLCRHFSLLELRHATSDFTPSLIIGHGGFGNVYKGTVTTDAGPTPVAIKRLNPLSGQGAREFTTEIELLSKLRHLHLVSLIGYCDDAGEMILVYEFMSNGTLRDHLYPHPAHHLPWPQRLQICVGAARGLHYLHTGTHRMIIHRDVKSTNILVDDKWVAKVSDFGLSKLGGTVGGDLTHVSTAVKGSFGYVDPEYYRRQQLTEKSDVYSFGVVLFEVLCGRAAVNPTLPKEQVNLRIWARRNLASGTLDTIVDPNLKGQIAPECLRKFGEVAESCVRDDGANRPSMVDVIWGLEFALQLQTEAAEKSADLDYVDKDVFGTNSVASPATDITSRLVINSDENTWTSVNNSSSGLFSSSTSADHQGGSTDVFSQIFKPEGR